MKCFLTGLGENAGMCTFLPLPRQRNQGERFPRGFGALVPLTRLLILTWAHAWPQLSISFFRHFSAPWKHTSPSVTFQNGRGRWDLTGVNLTGLLTKEIFTFCLSTSFL